MLMEYVADQLYFSKSMTILFIMQSYWDHYIQSNIWQTKTNDLQGIPSTCHTTSCIWFNPRWSRRGKELLATKDNFILLSQLDEWNGHRVVPMIWYILEACIEIPLRENKDLLFFLNFQVEYCTTYQYIYSYFKSFIYWCPKIQLYICVKPHLKVSIVFKAVKYYPNNNNDNNYNYLLYMVGPSPFFRWL